MRRVLFMLALLSGCDLGYLDACPSCRDASTNVDGGNGSDYASVVSADSPLAWYRFEEAPNATVAKDSSGNGHDGQYQPGCALGTAGRVGNGLTLAGQGWVAIADNANALGFLGNVVFSVELWFKASTRGSHMALVAREDGTTGWDLFIDNFVHGEREGAKIEEVTGDYSANVWIHVVFTYDGAVERLYLNGVLQPNTKASATTIPANSNRAIFLGADTPTMSSRFEGQLDEVALYAKALPQERVTAHYQAGR